MKAEKQCRDCVHNDVCYVAYLMEKIGPPLFISEFNLGEYCERYLNIYEVSKGRELYNEWTKAEKERVQKIIAEGRGDEL